MVRPDIELPPDVDEEDTTDWQEAFNETAGRRDYYDPNQPRDPAGSATGGQARVRPLR